MHDATADVVVLTVALLWFLDCFCCCRSCCCCSCNSCKVQQIMVCKVSQNCNPISISIFNFLAIREFMTQPSNSSSPPPPPPSSLSFMALVVVEQPAAFVDGMACFDGCHGDHDILHCSVVGTVEFVLFMGAFIIVLHTCFFHCCHCH